jgi:hypothetical protein
MDMGRPSIELELAGGPTLFDRFRKGKEEGENKSRIQKIHK